jgi:hypothetical protein
VSELGQRFTAVTSPPRWELDQEES